VSRWGELVEILDDPIRFNQEFGHRIRAWLEMNPPDIPLSALAGRMSSQNFRQSAWTEYTPALTASTTSPTLGSGSAVRGQWTRQADRTIHADVRIDFGTSGVAAGSGTYRVSLPVDAAYLSAAAIGSGWVFDSSVTTYKPVTVVYAGSSLANLVSDSSTGLVTNAIPWIWAASDVIALNLTYQAAS
jgi:hypothetical protein